MFPCFLSLTRFLHKVLNDACISIEGKYCCENTTIGIKDEKGAKNKFVSIKKYGLTESVIILHNHEKNN